MIRKVLIANRGGDRGRIIRACREMGILTVAVYSEADREALRMRSSRMRRCASGRQPPSKDSYLNMERILSAALVTGADAVHPGFDSCRRTARLRGDARSATLRGLGHLLR